MSEASADTTSTAVRVGRTSSGGSPEHETGIPVSLPLEEVLVGRAFTCGKSGSGKSNSASVVIERILDAGRPLLIIDIEGEYYGLKEEYEILHAGADETCDIQVGPEHGDRLAQLGIEQGVPIILDLSGFLDESEADDLVGAVARSLFATAKQAREPFPMFVEECHEFLPQQGSAGETGEAMVRISKRGRKHGLGLVGISQRPASVDKDFITQCNWLVWHRLSWDNDVAVVKRVLGSSFANKIDDLSEGEAYLAVDPGVLADEDRFDDVLRVQFDRKETYDAGQAPGLSDERRPELKGVDESLVEELQDISDRAQQRQNERDRLRETVAAREERIDDLEAELEDTKDIRGIMDDMVGSIADHAGVGDDAEAGTPAGEGEPVTVTIEGTDLEVPEVIQTEVMEIREDRRDAEARVEELEAAHTRQQRAAEHLTARLVDRPTSADIEALRQFVAEFGELTDRHADVVGEYAAVSAGDAGDERLALLRERAQTAEERAEELEAEIERLEATTEAGIDDQQFMDALELLRHPATKQVVARAGEQSKTNVEHMWDVLFVLAERDEADTQLDDIVPLVDVARTSVSDILSRLREHDLVRKDNRGKQVYYELRRDALELIIEQQQKRDELDDLRAELEVENA